MSSKASPFWGGTLLLVAFVSTALILFRGEPSNVGAGRRLTTTDVDDLHVASIPLPLEDSLEHFERYTWPTLKESLCPKGVPNLDFATTLFRLARVEVFGSKDEEIASNEPPSEFLTKFYDGDFGASMYTDNNSPNLTIIFARIYKCGNNQIRSMEKKLWHNRNGTYRSSVSLKDVLSNTESTEQFSRRNVEKGELCIYTAIRDPISHFLSGYNEVEYRIINNVDLIDNPALAPYNNVSYEDSHESRKQRFSQFVKDVIQEDTAFAEHFVYKHFMPMCRILSFLDHYNRSLTGYLPSLDNIDKTWPVFMAKTCPQVPPPEEMPEMSLWGQHKSSKDPLQVYRAAKDVWQDRGPIARALCIVHAFDYACWDALPDGIPLFCQEVFGSKSFTDIIHMKSHRL